MQLVLFSSVIALALLTSSVRADEFSEKDLKEAQRLYTAKCAKCHKFYDPAGYSKPEWQDWMLRMGKKSKLKTTQQDLLNRYTEMLRGRNSKALAAEPGKP